jgi:glucosyltransferase Lgt1/2/3
VLKDILIWLSPVYELGTYTDFDVEIDTNRIKMIDVNKPLLMPIGSLDLDLDSAGITLNNNVLAVVDSKAAMPIIRKVQANIFSACSSFEAGKSYFENSNQASLGLLHEFSKGKSTQIARKNILEICASNTSYCYFFARQVTEEDKKLDFIAAQERKLIQDQVKATMNKGVALYFRLQKKLQLNANPQQQKAIVDDFAKWVNETELKIKSMKALVDDLNNETLVTNAREKLRTDFMSISVLASSGLMNIRLSLFGGSFCSKDILQKEVIPFSFAHYGLNVLFSINDRLDFHVSRTSREPLPSNDLSWLPEGENIMIKEDNTIDKAVSTLQAACHAFNARKEYGRLFKSSNDDKEKVQQYKPENLIRVRQYLTDF